MTEYLPPGVHDECEAEIERLREGWRTAGSNAVEYLHDLRAAQAEIERLRRDQADLQKRLDLCRAFHRYRRDQGLR